MGEKEGPLYQWQEASLPLPCSREEFVTLIFDLGEEWEQTINTLVTAVMIGDRFVAYQGPRSPYRFRLATLSASFSEAASAIYSIELAHAALLLASKWYEEGRALSTRHFLREINNYYLIKLEWEIFSLFLVPRQTFLTLSYDWVARELNEETCYRLALIPKLGQLDPRAVLVGALLLQQHQS